jgi:hypothetical protein
MGKLEQEHWTENDVLVENFVLERLSETELQELKQHLARCARCRGNVEREQRIVGAAKSLGRALLKQRLGVNLKARAERQIPWPHILSTAALIAIIIGVGTYYRWYKPAEPADLIPMSKEQPIAQQKSESSQEKITSESSTADADVQRGVDQTSQMESNSETGNTAISAPGKESIEGLGASIRGGRESELSLQKEKMGRTKVAAVESDKKRTAGDDFRRDVASELQKNPEPTAVGFAKKSDALWVDGQVQAREDAAQNRSLEESEVAGDEISRLRINKDEGIADSPQERRISLRQEKITLEPKTVAQLPSSQWLRQQQIGAKRVQTLVEETPAGLQLTMFFENSLDSTLLAGATAEQISSDSLVVFLDGQVITYKLPAAFTGAKEINTKR